MGLRNTDVLFSPRPYQFYKLVISQVTQNDSSVLRQIERVVAGDGGVKSTELFVVHRETIRVDGVSMYARVSREVSGGTQTIGYPLSIGAHSTDSATRSSTYRLISNREPLSRIRCSFRESNFKRLAVLAGTNDTTADSAWTTLAEVSLYKIAVGGYRDSLLSFSLSASSRYAFYRVTMADHDNIPLTLVAAEGEGPAYDLLFQNTLAKGSSLYFGGDSIPAGSYDLAEVLSRAPAIQPDYWQIGEVKPNALWRAAGVPKKSIFVNTRLMFVGAVLLMVIVLAVVLVKAVPKINGIES
jgi:hypothetical protein